MSLRHTLVNIVCGFVPGKKARTRVRVFLMYPVAFSYVKYVKQWARENCGGVQSLSMAFGVGCRNLVVVLNKEHVFKFLLVKVINVDCVNFKICVDIILWKMWKSYVLIVFMRC